MTRSPRSAPIRTPTGSNGIPIASYSGLFQPAPIPMSSRPPDSRSSVASSCASTAGYRRLLLEHEGADAQTLGHRCDLRQRQQRGGQAHEVVGNHEPGAAHRLRLPAKGIRSE